jgi:hypothetical protein
MGVTLLLATRYNNVGMISDAPQQSQFAPARVLDPLSGVSAAILGGVAFAGASQLIR